MEIFDIIRDVKNKIIEDNKNIRFFRDTPLLGNKSEKSNSEDSKKEYVERFWIVDEKNDKNTIWFIMTPNSVRVANEKEGKYEFKSNCIAQSPSLYERYIIKKENEDSKQYYEFITTMNNDDEDTQRKNILIKAEVSCKSKIVKIVNQYLYKSSDEDIINYIENYGDTFNEYISAYDVTSNTHEITDGLRKSELANAMQYIDEEANKAEEIWNNGYELKKALEKRIKKVLNESVIYEKDKD